MTSTETLKKAYCRIGENDFVVDTQSPRSMENYYKVIAIGGRPECAEIHVCDREGNEFIFPSWVLRVTKSNS